MEENVFSIVIADDDIDDHYFLKETIKQNNIKHSCKSVYNGLELMDLLLKRGKYKGAEDEGLPDLIILDLNMPLLDGFGALAQIKSNPLLKNIPIYVLSTTHFEYDIKKSKELGAADFYCKPYQYEKLRGIVEEMFSKTVNPDLNNDQE